MSRSVGRILLVLLALPLLQGCYIYRSVGPDEIAPGQRVRARLAPGEAVRLEEFTAEGSRSIDGNVVELQGDSALISVTVHSELQGNRIRNLEQRIMVDRGGIIDLELRTMDRGRTAFVAVVATAGILSLALLKAKDNGTINPQDPSPPDESRISLFRFAFPWF